jgi:hypothetical protein
VHCSLESGGRLFSGDAFRGINEDGRLNGSQRTGRVVDVPSDTSGGVAQLRAASEDHLWPRESTGDHDEGGPSGVGTAADCRTPSFITGPGAHHAPS